MRRARRRVCRPDRPHRRDQRDYASRIRVAVITGGSSGIGAALARKLSVRGWRCVLVARGRERLDRIAGEIDAEAETCDVAERAQVEELAARVGDRHRSVHLLVNNAGIPAGGGYLTIPAERIDSVTQVNYLGGVWCLRAFLPLLEAGAPSAVVNVTSVAGTVTVATSGPYAASKHAQLAFSRSIAHELAPRGIRVHSVNPGPVPTVGFPQQRLLDGRWSRHAVVSTDTVANAILRALDDERAEVFVPPVFRLAAAAQALVPGTFARLAALRDWRG
ncbi:MAG: SDR family oxidoreductase [Actinomycetota bacterium]|nr:SDR family oxidoreductase [Actinomycetota bacterium]